MKKLVKKLSFISLLALLLAACVEKEKPQAEITDQEILDHISFLASDSLKGRKSGTEGNRIAAAYIKDQFKDYGLELLGNDGLQSFNLDIAVSLGEDNQFEFNQTSFAVKDDYIPLNVSSSGAFESELVFVGFGFSLENDSIQWDDYEGVDVKNKIVLVLMGDPEPDKDESAFIPESDNYSKILNAKDHGAGGIIFVSGPEFKPEDVLEELTVNNNNAMAGIPVLQITRAACNRLLKTAHQQNTIEELEEGIIKSHQPHRFIVGGKVILNIDLKLESGKTSNVLARVEGSDPELKNEYIVVGAHFDHLGMGGKHSGSRVPDTIAVHNGADDNASGTAGVIELAGYVQAHKNEFRRSVLFMAFTGEEMGLLGSKFFVNNPLLEMGKVVAMINFDMIGRLKADSSIMVGGTGTTPFADSLLQLANQGVDLKMNYSAAGFGASDHSSFYGKKIPVFFITSGSHLQYHTPQDDVELINIPGEKKILDFALNLLKEIDGVNGDLHFTETGSEPRSASRKGMKVTLGIMPDFTGGGNDGLGVDFVNPEGAAAGGGMLKGDKIVALNGMEVRNIYDYMARMKKFKKGQTITIDIVRDKEPLVLIVQL